MSAKTSRPATIPLLQRDNDDIGVIGPPGHVEGRKDRSEFRLAALSPARSGAGPPRLERCETVTTIGSAIRPTWGTAVRVEACRLWPVIGRRLARMAQNGHVRHRFCVDRLPAGPCNSATARASERYSRVPSILTSKPARALALVLLALPCSVPAGRESVTVSTPFEVGDSPAGNYLAALVAGANATRWPPPLTFAKPCAPTRATPT